VKSTLDDFLLPDSELCIGYNGHLLSHDDFLYFQILNCAYNGHLLSHEATEEVLWLAVKWCNRPLIYIDHFTAHVFK